MSGVDFYGNDSRVWLELPGGVRASARLDGSDPPTAGDDVSVTVRGAALVFPPGDGAPWTGTAVPAGAQAVAPQV